MIDTLHEIIGILEKIDSQLNIDIMTIEEIQEGKDNIISFQDDFKLLKTTIQRSKDPSIPITETLIFLNQYFGNIIQDLQNIEEIIIASACRYRDHQNK